MTTLQRLFWVGILISAGVVSRMVPHPPGFTGLLAVALFAGSVLPVPLAMISVLTASLIGDYWLGFHDLMWVVYLSLFLMIGLGRIGLGLMVPRSKCSWLGWAARGLLGSVGFFITTNLAVWWSQGMYPHTIDGLMTCFALGLPFFHNSVLATWIYLGAFEGVRRWQFASAAELLT